MSDEQKKRLAKGIAALCVANVWSDALGGFHGRPEVDRFMRDAMNRIYTVLQRMDDPDFLRKLALYGSLSSNLWGEPQEMPGLLESGFVASVDRMSDDEQEDSSS